MLRLSLICLFGWLLTGSAQAQLTLTQRLEISTRDDANETFDVTPLAERGLLLTVQRDRGFAVPAVDFSFQCYDTTLIARWSAQFRPEEGFRPLLSYQNGRSLYWLLAESESEKIAVLRVSLDDGTTDSFEGTLIDQMEIQLFKVLNNTAYIAGYHHNRPVALAFSFFDRAFRVLPGLYANNVELNGLEIDETRQEVHVLTHTDRRGCTFLLRSYTADGKPTRTLSFAGNQNSLVSGKLLPVNADEFLLIGNYSTDCTPYSQGVYVANVAHTDAGTFDPARLRLIPFSDLEHFFDYLRPKQQERLRLRIGKRLDQGKDLRLRYRLLVHDPIPTADGLTLVAEVYYPQYKATTTSFYRSAPPIASDRPVMNGLSNQLNRPGPRGNDRGFDGFRYTHAFLCGFDRKGNLLWDNCLPIKDLTSPTLSNMVQIAEQDGRLVLAYPSEGQISTEIIRRNQTLSQPETFDLKAAGTPAKEKIVYSDDGNVAAWYGSNFLAFGFQKVQADRPGLPTRSVFYLSKLGLKSSSKSERVKE